MYKAFNSDMTLNGYQFEIGKTYESEEGVEFEFCVEMQDCFYQHDINSRICEVKAEEIVEGNDKSTCRKITIIRELPKQEIMDRITNSLLAYLWARDIGNRKEMIDRVTESRWAHKWAEYIGNREVMIDRVTDSEHAYYWALHIGNHAVMIDRITNSKYAFWWAMEIGNHAVMIDRVTESKWAYRWAMEIGDQEVMLPRITDESQRGQIEKNMRSQD